MKKTLLFFGLIVVVAACSTKKNGAINRAYHSTTSKFNPLFNGQEALRYGTLDITQSYQDNYWLRLSVDPYQLHDVFSEEKTATNFLTEQKKKQRLLFRNTLCLLVVNNATSKLPKRICC